MSGGIVIYLILLSGVTLVHVAYFGEPLSSLWFHDRYDLLDRSTPLPAWESYLSGVGIGRFERDVLLGAASGLIFVAISRVMSKHLSWAGRLDDEFSKFFRGQRSAQLTALAVSSSLVEEIVFRGWLQGLIGWAAASVLFGLLHIPPQRSHWPWTLTALIMGGVFGGLYEWRGSVTVPAIAHFTINHFNLHALARRADYALSEEA